MSDATDKIRCDACPVMCCIAPGQDRRLRPLCQRAGRIIRTDPVVMLEPGAGRGPARRALAVRDWDGRRCRPTVS
ncbi:MAG: hypothetical protein R3D63_06340 [Paracoccaceae bacterium]